jgi:hypothetical protein
MTLTETIHVHAKSPKCNRCKAAARGMPHQMRHGRGQGQGIGSEWQGAYFGFLDKKVPKWGGMFLGT